MCPITGRGFGSGVSPPRNVCKLWANLHSEPFPGKNELQNYMQSDSWTSVWAKFSPYTCMMFMVWYSLIISSIGSPNVHLISATFSRQYNTRRLKICELVAVKSLTAVFSLENTAQSFHSMNSENLCEPSPILAPLGEILCEPRRLWRHGSRAPACLTTLLTWK